MSRPNLIPSDGAALERVINDPDRVQEIARAGKLGELVTAYAAHTADTNPRIQAQVREQAQAQVADMIRSGGLADGRRPDMRARRAGTAYERGAAGAALDGITSSAGEFFAAVAPRRSPSMDEVHGRIRAAMGSNAPESGGVLVPEQYRSEIMSLALEQSVVRPRATVIGVDAPRTTFPAVRDDARSVGALFGGIVAGWAAEGEALNPTAPKFGALTMDVCKMGIYAETPNELLQDVGALDSWLRRAFAAATADTEDAAFLTGNGVGKPLGALNPDHDATIVVDKESGQPAGTIVWENLVKMFARMLPSSLNNAVWVANIDTFPELATMALAVGTGGAPTWLADGPATPPTTILGRPLIFTEKSPILGETGDIAFIDFAHYLIADRQEITVTSSEHFLYNRDMTAFRCVSRLDGRPGLLTTLKPRNGAPVGGDLSPFVLLGERA